MALLQKEQTPALAVLRRLPWVLLLIPAETVVVTFYLAAAVRLDPAVLVVMAEIVQEAVILGMVAAAVRADRRPLLAQTEQSEVAAMVVREVFQELGVPGPHRL